jgi:hypothetical protein
MKIKQTILPIIFTALLFGFNYTKGQNKVSYNIKVIHVLKDKKGNLLGNVYIEDFKNDVFRKLLITKQKKGKIDTLYFINNWKFSNPNGVDITFSKEDFNGYKIEYLKDDSIQLFGIGKGIHRPSDPAIITWNYDKKIFEVLQAP